MVAGKRPEKLVMQLSASNLSFGYPGHRVGHDLDLDFGPGEVLCLLGPNGCGKTTLFKTLLGLLPRQGGEIRIGADRLEALRREDIAKRIAYVPQAHDAVFPYSVSDMVLMGRTAHRGLFSSPRSEDRQRVDEALATLGIDDLAGRDYTRISGGQRQLALIARALVQDAPLIVMDEPTASLDFGNQVLVMQQVQRLAATGLGIVLSTHNPDHAFACGTTVLVLAEGTRKALGPPIQVLTGEMLSSIYGVAVSVETLANGSHVCSPQIDAH
jgi:iron complex transport system ATP-binding protein